MKALVLSLLVAVGLWWSYQAGQNEVTIECQKILADLSEQSEKSRKADEVKINVIETKRVKDEQAASERTRSHVKRLRQPVPVVPNIVNNCACSMPDDVGRVLREASDDPRLSKTSDTAIPSGATETTPNAGQ